MSRSLLRIGVCSGALVTLVPGFIGTSASAQERFTVDAGVSVGAAYNPYLETGGGGATGSATAQISPSYITESELTTLQLSGNVSRTEYFDRYPANDSYALTGSGSHALSDRSRLSAQLGYVNSIVGGFNDLGVIGRRVIVPGVTAGQPVDTPAVETTAFPEIVPTIGNILPGVITDPSLGGLGRRRKSYQIGAGFSTQLGPRDNLYTNVSTVASRTAGSFDNFNYVSQGIGYSRTISEKLAVSLDGQVGRSDYLRTRRGDSTFYQPSVGVVYQVSARTRMSLNAGASINRVADVTGITTSTGFNGSASYCRQDVRWDACLSLSRATVPSSFQGVRTQNAAALSFGYRVGPRDSLSLSASYSRSGASLGQQLPGVLANRTEYYNVRGNYSRVLSPRLSAVADIGVSRANDNVSASRNPSVEGRIGLSYRFGADR